MELFHAKLGLVVDSFLNLECHTPTADDIHNDEFDDSDIRK